MKIAKIWAKNINYSRFGGHFCIFGVLYYNIGGNYPRGLKFGVPVTPLNVNKMAVSNWNSMKFGICGLYNTKFCMKKKISPKILFWAEGESNFEKVAIFTKKRKKTRKTYLLFQKWSDWPQNWSNWSSPMNKTFVRWNFWNFEFFRFYDPKWRQF